MGGQFTKRSSSIWPLVNKVYFEYLLRMEFSLLLHLSNSAFTSGFHPDNIALEFWLIASSKKLISIGMCGIESFFRSRSATARLAARCSRVFGLRRVFGYNKQDPPRLSGWSLVIFIISLRPLSRFQELKSCAIIRILEEPILGDYSFVQIRPSKFNASQSISTRMLGFLPVPSSIWCLKRFLEEAIAYHYRLSYCRKEHQLPYLLWTSKCLDSIAKLPAIPQHPLGIFYCIIFRQRKLTFGPVDGRSLPFDGNVLQIWFSESLYVEWLPGFNIQEAISCPKKLPSINFTWNFNFLGQQAPDSARYVFGYSIPKIKIAEGSKAIKGVFPSINLSKIADIGASACFFALGKKSLRRVPNAHFHPFMIYQLSLRSQAFIKSDRALIPIAGMRCGNGEFINKK